MKETRPVLFRIQYTIFKNQPKAEIKILIPEEAARPDGPYYLYYQESKCRSGLWDYSYYWFAWEVEASTWWEVESKVWEFLSSERAKLAKYVQEFIDLEKNKPQDKILALTPEDWEFREFRKNN